MKVRERHDPLDSLRREPPLVGNDVVDLEESTFPSTHSRKAWIARVCCPSEIEWLGRSNHLERDPWLLWSAKESAFKIAQRIQPNRRFRHSEFAVDPDHRIVAVDGRKIAVDWSIHEGCLSCCGIPASQRSQVRYETRTRGIESLSIGDDERLSPREQASVKTTASLKVRVLAKRLVSEVLSLPIDELEIVRYQSPESFSGWTPPRVLYQGQHLDDICVSLAHHGRFCGCAVAWSLVSATLAPTSNQLDER